MKKSFLLLLALFAAFSASAQYNVGDLYEKDGIPCIVIKVDETGEHGTILSLTPSIYYTQASEEMNYEAMDEKTRKKSYGKIVSLANKKYKEYVKSAAPVAGEVAPKLGKDGKENAAVIRQYCAEKNIDLAQYFPEQAWAENLGEGWYVPADNELEDYSYVIGLGLGKALYPKGNGYEVNKISKAFYAKYMEILELCKTTDGFQKAVVPNVIFSSTLTSDKSGVKRHVLNLCTISVGVIEYRLYRAIDEFSFPDGFLNVTNISNCACCDF